MDDVGLSSRASGAALAPETAPSTRAVVRKTVYVHATPAAAVAEMDARRRDWTEWLAVSRSRAGDATAAK